MPYIICIFILSCFLIYTICSNFDCVGFINKLIKHEPNLSVSESVMLEKVKKILAGETDWKYKDVDYINDKDSKSGCFARVFYCRDKEIMCICGSRNGIVTVICNDLHIESSFYSKKVANQLIQMYENKEEYKKIDLFKNL